jgi:hypothetical protein
MDAQVRGDTLTNEVINTQIILLFGKGDVHDLQ